LNGERHPVTAAPALVRAAQYLSTAFAGVGLRVSTHDFSALDGRYRNVIGHRPPLKARAGAAEAPLIIAAHYDTAAGSPGADDNASGLAVMLEVARRLYQQPLSRPIDFIAFCLEEFDLLGSLAYAASLREQQRPIHGAIVLECVGYTADVQQAPPGTPVEVPPRGDFLAVVGNESSAGLVKAIDAAGRTSKSGLKMVPLVVPGNGERLPDTRRSDHAAFWHHGYHAVMLTDTANFRNPHYHRPTDVPSTLDFAFMERVVATVTATALALAGSERS
jgi:Zn-dependent M28 family amino/carboxypeptidase